MSFAPGALSLDGFLGGRLRLWQPRQGYRAATDPVLLAAFVAARPGESALDMGCGVGTAGLCLARRVPDLDLHGLELQDDYAELARRNGPENGLALRVHVGDLRAPPADLRTMVFDQVLMNPPFHRADAATGPSDSGRDRAHREAGADLADWIGGGLRRLRPGGSIVMVHRMERLPEILAALDGPTGAIEVLPVAAREGRPAGRVLVRARKGRRAPFTLFAPLTIHTGKAHVSDGDDYTDIARKILRDASEILLDTRQSSKWA
jgi:tRNA1(Val) A37 N6-methylase TrmN6